MGAVDIPSRAQSYFLANPSLSGRGSAVAGSPRQIHLGAGPRRLTEAARREESRFQGGLLSGDS